MHDATTHLPVWHEFMVISANVYDSLVDASDNLQVDATQIAGVAVSTTTAQVGVNVVQVSTDALAADNLEAMLDGTGGTTLTTAISGNITGNLSGSVASVTGAVASVTGAVGSVAGSVGSVLGSVGSLAAQAKIDVNAEVVDALSTDIYAEPGQEAPGAMITLAQKIGYLYKFLRNKITQDATTLKIYADNGTTVDQKATISDDSITFTRGEIGTGP